MDRATGSVVRVIPETFERSVVLVRRRLAGAGFNIVGEFDISEESYLQVGFARQSCIVLLVDTPVLLLQAIALDRSAAVFLPLHVVITGDPDATYVHWVNPVAASGLRPPAPAKRALRDLYEGITETLSALPRTAAVDQYVRLAS